MSRSAFLLATALFSAHATLGTTAELVDYEIVGGTSIPNSLTGEAGDSERGRAVTSERKLGNCLACHQIPALSDEPFHGNVGPSLAGVANRYKEGELRLWVVDPKMRNPETIMPAFYRSTGLFRVMPEYEGRPILSAGQVEDVLAFLLTLTEESTAEPIPLRYDPGRITRRASGPGNPLPELISGLYFQIEESVDMQEDDLLNPGLLWVERGRQLWNQVEGAAVSSCASCHGHGDASLRGVGASYPKFHEPSGKVVNLEQQVNFCRSERMQAEPWEFGSQELLAMTIFVKHQSRGEPVEVEVDGPAAAAFERGKAHFYQRRGQLDMSCAHCHDQNFGKLLRGDVLTQGHSNGYPIYALGDESARHLHKLLWHCNELMRSTPFDVLSDEFVALELFLAWRGEGLPVETPGVRW
jgi:L-cysteine S-thiosulfotransferase